MDIKRTALYEAALRVKRRLSARASKPSRIAIELTNRCNLNCPYCLVGLQGQQKSVAHADLGRPLGTMDMALAEKIMKDAKEFGSSEIMLSFQGEPLLHDGFADMVSAARRYALKPVVVTNGLLLDPASSRRIIKAGLSSIGFSIDGASEETYGANKVGGSFKKVYRNLADMARIAREEKSPIKVIWQFVVMKNNEHEVDAAMRMAKELGVVFNVKTFAESVPELAPRDPKYRRRLQAKPCNDIYRLLCVYWNGDLVPCCYDLAGKAVLGNLTRNTLSQIWNSQRYAQFRKDVSQAAQRPENDPQLCRGCLKWTLAENRG